MNWTDAFNALCTFLVVGFRTEFWAGSPASIIPQAGLDCMGFSKWCHGHGSECPNAPTFPCLPAHPPAHCGGGSGCCCLRHNKSHTSIHTCREGPLRPSLQVCIFKYIRNRANKLSHGTERHVLRSFTDAFESCISSTHQLHLVSV